MNLRLGKLGQRLYKSVILTAIFIIIISIVAAISVRYSLTANIQGQRALDTIQDSATELYQSIIDQETGQRGYSLSKDSTYLEPYYKGTEVFTEHSEKLISLTKEYEKLNEASEKLIQLGEKWHSLGEQLVVSAENEEQADLHLLHEGKSILDEFRNNFSTFSAYVEAERTIVRNTMQFRVNFTLISLVLVIALITCINLYVNYRTLRSVIKPIIDLNNCVKTYTEHDFSRGVPYYSKNDELFELIQNVDVMRNELSQSINSLQSKVNIDELTGLYNRRYFNEYFTKQWEVAMTSSQNFSVILFDIDYYKKFNDTYGHLTGDECLKIISKSVTSMTNNVHFIARYGGEEFIVLLLNKTKEETLHFADAIRKIILDLKIPHSSSPTNEYVTVSLGVAVAIPSSTMYPDELISMADKALYQSKQNGRNQVTLYEEES